MKIGNSTPLPTYVQSTLPPRSDDPGPIDVLLSTLGGAVTCGTPGLGVLGNLVSVAVVEVATTSNEDEVNKAVLGHVASLAGQAMMGACKSVPGPSGATLALAGFGLATAAGAYAGWREAHVRATLR